jgi:hypothetical protein
MGRSPLLVAERVSQRRPNRVKEDRGEADQMFQIHQTFAICLPG